MMVQTFLALEVQFFWDGSNIHHFLHTEARYDQECYVIYRLHSLFGFLKARHTKSTIVFIDVICS